MSRSKHSTGPLPAATAWPRPGSANAAEHWRSLEELAQTPEFQQYLQSEFPFAATDGTDGVNRRQALRLLGASLGLAGLTACTKQPTETIVPYVRAPEEIVPGKPLYYATATTLGGIASGVLVESHMGRPTKVEGNPQHPASLGGTDIFAQAAVLTLYDPDRSKVVIRHGRISSWVNFLGAVSLAREQYATARGAGLRILTETVTSPTQAALMRRLLTEFPEARWHQYEPVVRDGGREGARIAFGEAVNTIYVFEQADVIVSLDCDFLSSGPASVRSSREFSTRRRPERMNRLYMLETGTSITGAMADHRLAVRAFEIENFARAVAARLGVAVRTGETSIPKAWLEALVEDLLQHRGRCLVVAGDQQPAAVHALAHAINHALGNAGITVHYTEPVEAEPVNQLASLAELVEDMSRGRVSTLLILGGNPVYDAPADFDFRRHLEKVELRIHLGLYDNETSECCHWHLPEAHFFEAWADARAFDGTVTILQPLIEPLYAGRTAIQVLSAWLGEPTKSDYDLVREHWQARHPGGDFERWWRTALHEGVIAGTALPHKSVALQSGNLAELPPAARSEGLEICFRPDPTVWDGRFANNGWLQELPKPLSKLTWDNAALVSPPTAARLQLSNGDVVELHYRGRSVRAPVWMAPGHAEDAVTVHLGYGRSRGGSLANGAGFNAYALRTSDAPWSGGGLEIRKTADRYPLASTQHHHAMEGRHLVREATIEEYRRDPDFVHRYGHDPKPELTLYPGFPTEGYAWGMAIDLNACTGCSACVVACQAENNIAVVGKQEVARGRDMHWIRVDRYYKGDPLNPEVHHQPVPCMHCENAPCEVVCPVAATVHSEEGLNQMVYNRCVGTRYCSNNCPYKVRRFNFFLYSDWSSPSSLELLRNPDVTVRSRGVMEKCTYCVQRINAARIQAKIEDRRIRDGEVVTACQAVCPAQAIVFGDINDPDSRVAQLKKDPRNYGILTDLGTRPRTTYLGRLRNPNPALESA